MIFGEKTQNVLNSIVLFYTLFILFKVTCDLEV